MLMTIGRAEWPASGQARSKTSALPDCKLCSQSTPILEGHLLYLESRRTWQPVQQLHMHMVATLVTDSKLVLDCLIQPYPIRQLCNKVSSLFIFMAVKGSRERCYDLCLTLLVGGVQLHQLLLPVFCLHLLPEFHNLASSEETTHHTICML